MVAPVLLMMTNIFKRNVQGMTRKLSRACIGIAGCGGLGSNVAVMLVRAGVSNLVLADFDHVEASNLNRQHYFIEDIGRRKVQALADHLRGINPAVELDLVIEKVTAGNVKDIFHDVDILVEAFDRAESKQWLIQRWNRIFPEKPLIVGNGLAGYGNTDNLQVIKTGKLVFCGDMQSDLSVGLAAPRVLIVAGMQANAVIEILMEGAV